MSVILVVSPNVNCRRLYVDNLVRRGYVAVGVTSASEAERLLRHTTPGLVLICCMPTGFEREVEHIRTEFKLTGDLVLMSQDQPDKAWAKRWNVAVSDSGPVDLRRLLDALRPWLRPLDAAPWTEAS